MDVEAQQDKVRCVHFRHDNLRRFGQDNSRPNNVRPENFRRDNLRRVHFTTRPLSCPRCTTVGLVSCPLCYWRVGVASVKVHAMACRTPSHVAFALYYCRVGVVRFASGQNPTKTRFAASCRALPSRHLRPFCFIIGLRAGGGAADGCGGARTRSTKHQTINHARNVVCTLLCGLLRL